MSNVEPTEEPQGHVRVVYLGPVAPHWEVQSDYGDPRTVDEFRTRVLARLLLLPPHDPQFRRNRERVARDAERILFELEWDLGLPEDDAEIEIDLVGTPIEAGADPGDTDESPDADADAAPDGGGENDAETAGQAEATDEAPTDEAPADD